MLYSQLQLLQGVSYSNKSGYFSGRLEGGLFGFAGFRPGFLKRCSMHTLNLGVGQVVLGSAMQELMEEGVWQDKTQCYQQFLDFCRARKIPTTQPAFPTSTWERQKTEAALLSCKAYNSRVVTAWLSETCHEVLRPESSNLQVGRAACLLELARFYHLMEANPQYLSEEAGEAMKQTMDQFIATYRILCSANISKGVLRWSALPKVHFAEHLGITCKSHRLNPRFFHTFIDEDFMGQMRRLCIACHIRTAPLRCLQRFLLRLQLKWASRSDLVGALDAELPVVEARGCQSAFGTVSKFFPRMKALSC